MNGSARAYPLTVMEKVEVVNETVGDRAVVVAYCPLVMKIMLYERTLDGELVSLGTSGYTFERMHVLYDRRTDSLWLPRPDGLTAISGPLAGKVLRRVDDPVERTNWGDWQRRHPQTEVVVGGDRSRGIPFQPPEGVAARAL
jgi:hypothetical protein